MGGTDDADAVRERELAAPGGLGEHHDVIAGGDREVAALAGGAGQALEHWCGEADQLDLVEGACRQRKDPPADAVALGVLGLLDVAERDHGPHQVESRAVVQADALAELGEADAIVVARDLLQDRERPLQRLDAAAPGCFLHLIGAGVFDGACHLMALDRLYPCHCPTTSPIAWTQHPSIRVYSPR